MTRIKSLPGHLVSSTLLLLPLAIVVSASCAGPEEPSTICGSLYTDCDGVCVDTDTDVANCGDCDAACESGEQCLAGQCTRASGAGGDGGGGGGPACGAGLTECDGRCVDLQTDPAHCGDCDEACNPGRACSAGACQSECLRGLEDCAGSCVDLEVDPAHCGACGNVCDPRQKCQSGTCNCSVEPSEELVIPLQGKLTVTGTTVGADDTRWLPCTSPGAADRTFRFTAPLTGTYYIDTFGTAYDTVLGVQRADTCALLECNDDVDGGQGESKLTLDLVEGESYLVVVSGANGAVGDFTLNISQPPTCAPLALEPGVPRRVTGETPERGDLVHASCGGGGSPDALYTFTAPEAGSYVFQASAVSSTATMITSVHEGTSCLGAQLGCGKGRAAFVQLDEGQTVLVAVQSDSGFRVDFTLDVIAEPACPLEDLGSALPVSREGDTAMLVDRYPIWCGDILAGREATYRFTAPEAGYYIFDAEGSSAGTAIAVREDDGSCTGNDLGCDAGQDGAARVGVRLAEGQAVVVLVDVPGRSGRFSLNISRRDDAGACSSPIPLPQDVSQTMTRTVTGTTRGRPAEASSTCEATKSKGPDITYSFTAPEAGYYVFDTVGSSSVTRISAHEGSCTGRELTCASGEDAWAVGLQLAADQTVVIVVDSVDRSPGGDYTLNVSRLDDAGTCASPVVLPSEVPQTVTGSTLGRPREAYGSCGPLAEDQLKAGPDMVYSFTAPRDGDYTFDTRGSEFDTVLHVHDLTCAGTELGCGDDIQAPVEKTSETTVPLVAGKTVAIVVDGYESSAGAFTLNINAR